MPARDVVQHDTQIRCKPSRTVYVQDFQAGMLGLAGVT